MRVLLVAHGYPPLAGGGVELYTAALAERLTSRCADSVTVLTREQDPDTPEHRRRDEDRDGIRVCWINNTFRDTRSFVATYDEPAIRARAAALLDEVRPEIAHVHHLTCLSTTVLHELHARGIPVVLTLHDYWLLCHRGQLLNEQYERCPGPGDDGCARCCGAAAAAPPALVRHAPSLRGVERMLPRTAAPLRRAAQWALASRQPAEASRRASRERLAHMRDRWRLVDRVLAPSAHIRHRFLAAGFDDRITPSVYGTAIEPLPRDPPAVQNSRTALRAGYLGSVIASKAPHLLVEAAAQLAPAVAVHIHGAPAAYHGDDRYEAAWSAWQKRPGVTMHGASAHAGIASILAGLDVLVVPSVWEENSPFVIHEALACGVPVIASRIGGIPELVRDGVNGLLFEPGDVADLTRALRRLLDEPDLLGRLQASASRVRPLDDDVRATRELYQELVERNASARARTCRAGAARSAPRCAAVVLNYATEDQTCVAVRSLEASDRPFDRVVVVDNGDGAACRRALAGIGRHVTLHATGGNLGFSGGVNAGLAISLAEGAEFVFLLNSDAVLPPDALDLLLSAMHARPEAGIAAPVILDRAWPGSVASAGMDYDARSGRMRHRDVNAPAGAARPAWTRVAGVSGCAMLVRRAVFDRIGLLPEEYFFSFEDLAFCLAAREAGFEVGVVGPARVHHQGSFTMGTSPLRFYYAARNHLLMASRTPSGGRLARAGRAGHIVGLNLGRALRATETPLLARLGAVLRGTRDHLRGRYGPA